MPNYVKLAANTENAEKKRRTNLGRPWVKGQSCNPKGRPSIKPITDMFKSILNDPAEMELIRANIAKTLKDRGMAGVILINHMADRVEGKMPDEVTINDLRDLSDEELEERRKKLDAANS